MRILRSLLAAAILLGAIVLPAPAIPAIHAAPLAPNWNAPHAGEQLLVKLAPGGRSRLEASGATLIREIPDLGLALVQVAAKHGLTEAANELAADSAVEWAEPNYTFALDYVPGDPLYQGYQKPYLSRVRTEPAWDFGLGRPEIVIAVLDTGVDMQHEDLAGGFWTNTGEIPGNGVDDDGNGFIDDVNGWDFADNHNDLSDDYGHGTHVAGIAAARADNGKGIAGMAGRAKIMPVDVFNYDIGTYEELIRAIVYATDNGARVINMSLGATSYSKGEEAAVDYAYEHGVVVVAAAGNSGREEIHYPAAHTHVIAVSSTTAADTISSFSSSGDWVDVSAPGSSIYSTYPGNSYRYMSGTSMATPHVSGLAALILSRNSKLSPDQVRGIIEGTADDLGTPGRDIYYGGGRINADKALATTPAAALDIDLPGCTELITNGGFESGAVGWEMAGATDVVSDLASKGAQSLHFAGGANAHGEAAQTLVVDPNATAAVLKFDYRIEPADYGHGTSPDWPFDDWFTAEWRTADGKSLGRLLLTGNTADTVNSGLPWDHYLYRLHAKDLAALAAADTLRLVFTSQNDSDNLATEVWIDAVTFCAKDVPLYRSYLPSVARP